MVGTTHVRCHDRLRTLDRACICYVGSSSVLGWVRQVGQQQLHGGKAWPVGALLVAHGKLQSGGKGQAAHEGSDAQNADRCRGSGCVRHAIGRSWGLGSQLLRWLYDAVTAAGMCSSFEECSFWLLLSWVRPAGF
mmetsp:Transcript_29400/g.74986  ORF Transcript_29400/g.74986 Transcript_29400/m.74986 type:complete len:135 (-) Transcript_29400:399-803(-)